MTKISKDIAKKYLPLTAVSVVVLALILWFVLSRPKEYKAQLAMESDAMSIVNYYNPKRIRLQEHPLESNIKLPEFIFPDPKFGALVIGNGSDSLITIALDESPGKGESFLFIDRNNNEDLTDDEDYDWDDDKSTYWIKETFVDVNYKDGPERAVPYPITFYRYKDRLHDSIVAFRSGYRKGFVTLGDSTYKIGLFDDDLNGLFDEPENGAFVVDINRDGTLDGDINSPEYFDLTASFSVNGLSYKVKNISPSGDQIVFTKSDSVVSSKTALQLGLSAPSFQTFDINGEVIGLANFKNKVVLIDFWATWCKPWENELSNLKINYNKYQGRGFEIIGMNLDYDLDYLREFLTKYEILWPQISDSQGWDMALVSDYQVSALPKNFLLDRQGVIRYKDLRGENLRAKIYELLNEPEISIN